MHRLGDQRYLQSGLKFLLQRAVTRLAHLMPHVRRGCADLSLDGEQRGDTRQRLSVHYRILLDVQIVELAPDVRPAAYFDDSAIGISPIKVGGIGLQRTVSTSHVLLGGVFPRASRLA